MSAPEIRNVHVHYFAVLREEAGVREESVSTTANTALALYEELRGRHRFGLDASRMKVVVNEEFREWSWPLEDGDIVVFVPPVAGGHS